MYNKNNEMLWVFKNIKDPTKFGSSMHVLNEHLPNCINKETTRPYLFKILLLTTQSCNKMILGN